MRISGDEVFMRRAIRLASRGAGETSPNPMVGAVVVGDEVVGSGRHRGPGTAHAEVVALAEAGERARGATLYSTLEPCAHHGRTPPCVEAIVEAGIARVVAAAQDPDPQVSGRGFQALREAGLRVDVGVLEEEATRSNEAYFMHRLQHRPFVTYKAALSLDGRTAALDGSSRWISGPAARREVHRLRARADAVCVGVGTVLADDPHLDVRPARGVSHPGPLRVVIDSLARTPPGSKVVTGGGRCLIITTPAAPAERVEALEAAGAEVVSVEGEANRVSIKHALESLAAGGVMSVLLEGGPTLAGSFASAGLVDRYLLYLAPKLIGEGRAFLEGWAAGTMGAARSLRITSIRRMGEDLKIEATEEKD